MDSMIPMVSSHLRHPMVLWSVNAGGAGDCGLASLRDLWIYIVIPADEVQRTTCGTTVRLFERCFLKHPKFKEKNENLPKKQWKRAAWPFPQCLRKVRHGKPERETRAFAGWCSLLYITQPNLGCLWRDFPRPINEATGKKQHAEVSHLLSLLWRKPS